MLLYCMLKSFINFKPIYGIFSVCIVAFGIEFLQLINLLKLLGLRDNETARLILGTTFEIQDLIAYTLGGLTLLILEQNHKSHEHS